MYQDLEKRKAKAPTLLMELNLSSILEGTVQAHKRARFLYNKKDPIRACLVGTRLRHLILPELRLPEYACPVEISPKMSPARFKDALSEWVSCDPHSKLAVVFTDLQSHILSFSSPPQETAMVLQRMILDTVETVSTACHIYHRHYVGKCRVVTLSGYHTRKDSSIGHGRMETLVVGQEAIEMISHTSLVNRDLSPLMSGNMAKLFPENAEDPCPALKQDLIKEMHAALALAVPED